MRSWRIGQIVALLFSLSSPSVALQVPHAQSAPPVTASEASAAGAVFTSLQGIWICTEDTIDPTGANIGDVWPFDLHGETLDPDGNWEYTTTFNHEPVTSTGEYTFTMQWGNSPTMSPKFNASYLPDTDQIKFWSFTAFGGKPTNDDSSKYYMFNRTEPHNDTECTDKELYYNMQYYSCENYKKYGECSWVTAISRGKQVDASQFCRKTCGRCTPDTNTTESSPTPTPPTPSPPTPSPTAPLCPSQVVVAGGDPVPINMYGGNWYVSDTCPCREGEEITDPVDCARAACFFHQEWNVMKSDNQWPHHVKGCTKRTGPIDFGFWFNKDPTGACDAHGWVKPVCNMNPGR